MTLTQQVAIITGASSGIGTATALALAEQGAAPCPVGCNLATLEMVTAMALASGTRARSYQADLTLGEDIG